MNSNNFSNNPEPENNRPPVRKLKVKSGAGVTAIVCVLLFLGLASFAFLIVAFTRGFDFSDKQEQQTTAVTDTAPAAQETEADTEPEEPSIDELYDLKQYEPEEIKKGDLLLVNAEHEYSFYVPGSDIVSVYSNKNGDYLVSDTNVSLRKDVISKINEMMTAFKTDTGLSNIMIRTGYRDKATQEKLYQSKVDVEGEAEAKKTVSPPGCSDYHTATAFYAVIYTDNTVQPLNYDAKYSSWILENCHKYGFIRRFAPDKADITGISVDEWHFRYVGVPHAEIMYSENMCLEEYIEYLRKYPVAGEHLKYTCGDGSEYEIYFSEANTDKPSYVPLPKEGEYTVSGNNIDGYIVTLKVK